MDAEWSEGGDRIQTVNAEVGGCMKGKSKLAAAVFTVASFFIAIPSTHATTLFQSVPDLTGPTYPSGVCSACLGSFRVFDTFTLDSNSAIGAVTVSLYGYPFPVNMNVSIWTISGDLPDAQLFSQTFTPAEFVSVVEPDRAIVTVNSVGLSLLAGTYDISFYNSDSLAVKSYSGGSGLLYQQGHGFVVGASAGFILSGDAGVAATPLPASLPLFASGLGALGLLGWRRKRKPQAA